MKKSVEPRIGRLLLGLAVTLAALIFSPRCAARSATLWQGTAGPFYNRALLWEPADLTEPNLRSLYRELAAEFKGTRAWAVTIFVNRDDAIREAGGKLRIEDVDYNYWLAPILFT